ncbi:putative tetratricopeptide-like helical domain superfamily [Helianthus anomalus]
MYNFLLRQRCSVFEFPSQFFKSGQKFGSFRMGDSTIYTLIENFSKARDFSSLENVFIQMKHERKVFIEGNFILAFKAYNKANQAEKALDLFHKLWVDYQCTPTVRSFNSVITVVLQQGLYDKHLAEVRKTNSLLFANCRGLVHLFSYRCLQMWSADCRRFTSEKTNSTLENSRIL